MRRVRWALCGCVQTWGVEELAGLLLRFFTLCCLSTPFLWSCPKKRGGAPKKNAEGSCGHPRRRTGRWPRSQARLYRAWQAAHGCRAVYGAVGLAPYGRGRPRQRRKGTRGGRRTFPHEISAAPEGASEGGAGPTFQRPRPAQSAQGPRPEGVGPGVLERGAAERRTGGPPRKASQPTTGATPGSGGRSGAAGGGGENRGEAAAEGRRCRPVLP